MWSDNARPMTRFEVIEIPETKCVSKVDPKSPLIPKPLNPIGKECEIVTRQALLVSGLPNMGRRKVQMPTCEGHIKVYMGEAPAHVQATEGPKPSASPLLCPDCGKHPVAQPCRLGPRRL